MAFSEIGLLEITNNFIKLFDAPDAASSSSTSFGKSEKVDRPAAYQALVGTIIQEPFNDLKDIKAFNDLLLRYARQTQPVGQEKQPEKTLMELFFPKVQRFFKESKREGEVYCMLDPDCNSFQGYLDDTWDLHSQEKALRPTITAALKPLDEKKLRANLQVMPSFNLDLFPPELIAPTEIQEKIYTALKQANAIQEFVQDYDQHKIDFLGVLNPDSHQVRLINIWGTISVTTCMRLSEIIKKSRSLESLILHNHTNALHATLKALDHNVSLRFLQVDARSFSEAVWPLRLNHTLLGLRVVSERDSNLSPITALLFMQGLTKLVGLEHLSLAKVDLCFVSLNQLLQLPRLRSLRLQSCKLSSLKMFIAELDKPTHLEFLQLHLQDPVEPTELIGLANALYDHPTIKRIVITIYGQYLDKETAAAFEKLKKNKPGFKLYAMFQSDKPEEKRPSAPAQSLQKTFSFLTTTMPALNSRPEKDAQSETKQEVRQDIERPSPQALVPSSSISSSSFNIINQQLSTDSKEEQKQQPKKKPVAKHNPQTIRAFVSQQQSDRICDVIAAMRSVSFKTLFSEEETNETTIKYRLSELPFLSEAIAQGITQSKMIETLRLAPSSTIEIDPNDENGFKEKYRKARGEKVDDVKALKLFIDYHFENCIAAALNAGCKKLAVGDTESFITTGTIKRIADHLKQKSKLQSLRISGVEGLNPVVPIFDALENNLTLQTLTIEDNSNNETDLSIPIKLKNNNTLTKLSISGSLFQTVASFNHFIKNVLPCFTALQTLELSDLSGFNLAILRELPATFNKMPKLTTFTLLNWALTKTSKKQIAAAFDTLTEQAKHLQYVQCDKSYKYDRRSSSSSSTTTKSSSKSKEKVPPKKDDKMLTDVRANLKRKRSPEEDERGKEEEREVEEEEETLDFSPFL